MPKPEFFQDVLDRFKIDEWDMVLVGDGSGSKWGYPVGWGVTAVLKKQMDRRVFYGAMNDGTVNIAEVMAYLQPLMWYMAEVRKQRKQKGTTARKHVVHIITDSEYARKVGEKGHLDFNTNQPLWAVFEFVKRQAIELHWHWAEREEIALNIYADALSKRARKQVKENDQVQSLAGDGYSAEEFNPWE